jgi:hypothetical protein
MAKPLRELLAERTMRRLDDDWDHMLKEAERREDVGDEMARRLRALDEYVGKLTPQVGRKVRRILDGENSDG